MADRKLPPDRESWDASEERLRSHIPNLEAFLQDIYTRSTGLSVEPTSAQYNALSAKVDANAAKAAVTSADVTSNHLSVLSQAISVISQQISAMSQKLSGLSVIAGRLSVTSDVMIGGVGPPTQLKFGGIDLGIFRYTGTALAFSESTVARYIIDAGGMVAQRSDLVIGWSPTTTATLTPDTTIARKAAAKIAISNDLSVRHLNVSGNLSAPILDTLSNQISVLSQAVSVLSQQVSVLSQGLSVVSVGVDRVSNAVSNETSNRISADNALSVKIDTVSNQVSVLSQQVSILSQQVSVHSQQISVLSQQVSVLSQQISILSVGVDRVSNAVSNETSNRMSADNVLSNQISVLSQQISILSQQVSVLSQAISVISQQVSVLSQKVSSVGAWAVRGLSGLVSGSSTVNLAADAIQFWNPTDKSINTVISATTVTNDVGLSADQVNGRDQAATYTSSVWIHFYNVLDGTTVKTRSSLAIPANGPALQGTEKAWAYAGAIRRNAANNLIATRMRGTWMSYQAQQTLISGGSATVETSLDLSPFIPPNTGHVLLLIEFTNATAGVGGWTANVRYISGSNYLIAELAVDTAGGNASNVVVGIVPNVAQTIFYLVPDAGLRMAIYILGYTVPNGG